jgi:hypothetical protein
VLGQKAAMQYTAWSEIEDGKPQIAGYDNEAPTGWEDK